MTNTIARLTSLSLITFATGAIAAGFEIGEQKGKSVTVSHNDRAVVKLMTGNDMSSKESAHETYKVYLHVIDPLDARGDRTITKGAGDKFTHHRGVYIGWSKMTMAGKSYDTWHMKGAVRQVFAGLIRKKTSAKQAEFTAVINWVDGQEVLLTEERTFVVGKADSSGAYILDQRSKITAVKGDAELNGDPEHAGCQFRASADVVKNKSAKYLFPSGAMSQKAVSESRDLPWAALSFKANDSQYHVQHMSHPSLPKGLRYSAYRDYGRFGSFFVTDIPKGENKTFKLRFYISPGAFPDSMVTDSTRRYADFAGGE
jgi:hypothetical protein